MHSSSYVVPSIGSTLHTEQGPSSHMIYKIHYNSKISLDARFLKLNSSSQQFLMFVYARPCSLFQ